MNTATKLRQTTSVVTMLSVLPHLLCCGIPAIAALIALGTTVGLAASLSANPFYMFVDAYHTELIILAICSVALSGMMNLIAYRIDCREAANQGKMAESDAKLHGHCTHASCAPKKSASLKLFAISCVLLCLDLAWFYTEEQVLGLHHHGEAVATEHAAIHDHHHD
jgi:hypothetical protein